ncbi:DnaJ-like protein 1 [Yarrowia sp. C11]|nr:DnaJ-like protein 1 [Yarrowia sp. C11]KAG5364615.1 DnaJ-like protein 1 [Yarrowia sp. E02]
MRVFKQARPQVGLRALRAGFASRKSVAPSQAVRFFRHSARLQMEDPYKALGVESNATAKEIKKSYYQLAKKFHPDVNKEEGAKKKFEEVQKAYELLSNEEERKKYDTFGPAAFGEGGQPGHGFGGGNPFAGGGNPFAGFGGAGFGGGGFGGQGINLDDLFSAAFGGQQGGRGGFGRQQPYVQEYEGNDIQLNVEISLEDVARGVSKDLKYQAVTSCTTCDGSGMKKDAKKTTCSACGGTGARVHVVNGGFQMSTTCEVCRGSGEQIPKDGECGSCHSNGVVRETRETSINIPPGVDNGTILRVSGMGDAPEAQAGPTVRLHNGDLLVRIHVKPSKTFVRQRSDLVYKQEIPMTTAALGGTVLIPTLLGGKLRIKVPAGTQPGAQIAIPEQGLPKGRNGFGDLKVIYDVKIAAPTDKTQTAVLETLADLTHDESARRSDGHVKSEPEAPEEEEKKHTPFLKKLFNRLKHHNE